MKRALALVSCAALLSGLAFSQSPEAKPAFEVADVHVSLQTRNPYMRGPNIRRGHYEIRFGTMVDLIRVAYGVDADRVLAGPNWVENDTYDVTAKVPEGATAETAKPMLQSLLSDRFGLVVRNETRSVPAFALKAGKHSQLKEADGTGETGCKFEFPQPPPAGGPPPGPPTLTYQCRNMTMAAFAEALHSTIIFASEYLNGRVVEDETELKGSWNFDFKYTLRGMMGAPGGDATTVTLLDAIEKQLGLKLEAVEMPLPVVVIESVNQMPTANAPNVAEALHIAPGPTEFEVATLKPTDPDFRGMRLQIQPGGRVTMAGLPVKFLVEQAWDLSDDMLTGAPKWIDTDRYDIVAKAAIAGREMDIEELWPMLRALVTDRFKLVSHFEERPTTAYTLTAVKPKMKKADPATRTKYKEGPAGDGKDPRNKNPILGRLVTCQNMTMAQFSAKLKEIAPGYIHSPVLDATKLEGGYDFTLSFSPAGASGGGGRGGGEAGSAPPGGASVAAASDPSGAVTLFEAIEKQIGLKLEPQKRPVKTLVIDHIEQKPTEN